LVVTREHIISERASTSSSSSPVLSGVPDLLLSASFSLSFSLGGSGDVRELRGVDADPS
jgi:hypothetical protein